MADELKKLKDYQFEDKRQEMERIKKEVEKDG